MAWRGTATLHITDGEAIHLSQELPKASTGELYTKKLEHRAYQALKQGYLTNARYLFEEIVQRSPRNVRAWRALIDLRDEIDLRVAACKRVLELEPFDDTTRARLETLEEQLQHVVQYKRQWAQAQTAQAKSLMVRGREETAYCLVRKIIKIYSQNPQTWWLLAQLSRDDLETRLHALRKAVGLDPQNRTFRVALTRWEYLSKHPEELVKMYEVNGKWKQALHHRYRTVLQTFSPLAWKKRRQDMLRLNGLSHSPPPGIARVLKIAAWILWPLPLHFVLFGLINRLSWTMLAHDGLFFIALAVTLLGSGLVTLIKTYADDILWQVWPFEVTKVTYQKMRRGATLTGWGLLWLSFGLWLWDALL